ncbi:MAG TPA: hypothetical protein VKV03_12010 [Candidatus Binataceae bacterium]|nr:hypothetical protein [Candidatus Binataceae bacterium]
MAKYTFLALTNPVAGKEDEFNEWYDKHHVPDVINVPGFVSGQRFKLADSHFGGEPSKAYKYLAVYEIETDDIAATLKELRARGGTADITPSDAIDRNALTYTFTPIREKVMAKDVRRPRRAA